MKAQGQIESDAISRGMRFGILARRDMERRELGSWIQHERRALAEELRQAGRYGMSGGVAVAKLGSTDVCVRATKVAGSDFGTVKLLRMLVQSKVARRRGAYGGSSWQRISPRRRLTLCRRVARVEKEEGAHIMTLSHRITKVKSL